MGDTTGYIARSDEARFALGLYADLRLGCRSRTGEPVFPASAHAETEAQFGRRNANFAVKACDEWDIRKADSQSEINEIRPPKKGKQDA